MLTIFSREVASFFNSLIAYIVITVFLVGVGMFFWVFGDNVLVHGLAVMDDLFAFAPWFFLFLIPAITMRSFSEEMKTGTIELLLTKPVTDWQIILGKYLASVFLVVFSLAPTVVYWLSLSSLTREGVSLDNGPIWGAYIGLIALGAIFTAIGIFSSSVSQNQIVSFLLALFLCFFFFMAFDFIADLDLFSSVNEIVLRIGIFEHFRSISKGVIDSRDVVYFLSFVAVGLIATKIALDTQKN
ncbi:MAG: ABC transporter permease subunit [Bacteroidia bacterium]|nr:ABC transporter permease subunit [Bacteroidia bacterium]